VPPPPPPPPPEAPSPPVLPPVPVTDPRPESPLNGHEFVSVTPVPLIPPPPVVARQLREPEPCSWVLAPASRRGALPTMCDDPCLDGKPFCPTHAAICYVRAAARREDAA